MNQEAGADLRLSNRLASLGFSFLVIIAAEIAVGVPVALAYRAWGAAALVASAIVFAAVAGYALFRGFRMGVILREDGVEVRNYLRWRFVPLETIEAIVPTAVWIPILFWVPCAGVELPGERKPLRFQSTVSWGLRWGRPSRHSQRIVATLQEWGAARGVPVRLSARYLSGQGLKDTSV